MSILKYCRVLVCAFICCHLNAQIDVVQNMDELLGVYDSSNSPGLSVKVISQGRSIYSKGFGLSNLDYNIKNSDSTVFSLASIAKQFTASAIWALVIEGEIKLEDDIRTYLPEFPEYDEVIRIKNLLNHTSGIRNYHTIMYLSGFDYDTIFYDNNTVFKLACNQKGLNNLPGEKVSYSNTNYNLLAIIVERISGQSLDYYLKHKILNPLKMNSTFVRIEHGKPIKNRAIGYKKQKEGFKFSMSNQLSYGAGSMGSSANDMAIWMQMLNEQILEFKALAQFLKITETLTTGEKAKYARGVMLDDYKGYTTTSHGGIGYGGRTQLITVKEKEFGIIVLTNLQSIDAPRIAYQILDILLSKNKKNLEKSNVEVVVKEQNINEFTGEYKEVHSDMTMKLFIENDTLKSMGSIGKMGTPLIQFEDNRFYRINSQNVKYDFTPSATHDMVITFGGTPFYFKHAKFIEADLVDVTDFAGKYYSEELDVTYDFFVENETLKLSYKENEKVSLDPVQLNEFGNNDRTLYQFTKDKKETITGMLLSCDGSVKDIIFKKKGTAN